MAKEWLTEITCPICKKKTKKQTGAVNFSKRNNRPIYCCRKCAGIGRRKGYDVKSPTYKIWAGIKTRCLNKNDDHYPKYGGAGVKICDRWKSSFINFLKDMGERPEGMSIDRINNEGDYEPSNCRWATPKEQARNRSSNRKLNYKGKIITVSELSEITGVEKSVIIYRLNAGLTLDESIKNKSYQRKGKNGKYVSLIN